MSDSVPSGKQASDPLRILLVDDDPVARRLATLMLQRLGCAADIAADGRAALEALRARSYELVLLDPEVPGPDGELIDAIVAAGGTPGPHLVAMSAAGDGPAPGGAVADRLRKPLALGALAEALARVPRHDAVDDFNVAAWAELRRVFKAGGAAELVAAALAELPQQQARHAAALAAADMVALGRELHALRGACLQLGATALAQLCAEAEQACAADQAAARHAGDAALVRYAALLARLQRELSPG